MADLLPPPPPVDGTSPPSAAALPQRFGKYTLLRKLATGGMAELFLALHRSVAGFEKLVVIKRILPAMNSDHRFIEMLLHEARIAATLSHPNIVQTFDVGMAGETYFIAMEHVHGEDVRSIVRQMKKMGVVELPLPHALAVIIGQCSGLAYAHEKRDLDGRPLEIVHRDISPQNVVVTFSGDVKIVDFGIATSCVRGGEQTKSGQLEGKIPYMSPEQAAGEEIDWRSDIFATGVMLFELTTGRRLFKGPSEVETLELIRERDYPRPSQVRPDYPPRLERIVMKALAKRREDRYQSARELQADLEAFVRDERIPVSQIALSEWMAQLFAEKLAQQSEALHDVKLLADEIAAGEDDADPSREAPLSSVMPSAPAAAHTVTSATALPATGGKGWLGALAVVALGGTGAFFYVHANMPKPTDEPPAAARPAQVELPQDSGVLAIATEPPGVAIGETASRIEATLPKEGGTLVVKTNVENPLVWIDGKSVPGTTVERLAVGEHKLLVGAFGYIGKASTFSAQAGETKTIEVKLERMRPKGAASAEAPAR